jgi:MtN3 and saliva related transmembrane protein
LSRVADAGTGAYKCHRHLDGKISMNSVTLLGLVAGCCTTLAYLPQVIKAWRTRSTRDISLGMFSLMACGLLLWLAYGLLLHDVPLIASNLVTFAFAATILYFKLRES